MVVRFGILITVLFLGYASLLFKVYDLQLVKGSYYLARAGSQYLSSDLAAANRGIIYFTDKDGKQLPAVLNRDYLAIYAAPKDIEDFQEAAHTLSPILGRSTEELEAIFSKKDREYEILVKRASAELVKEIKDLGIKGIYTEAIPGRFYPLGKLAAHLLGFVGPSNEDVGENGRYGVEKFYDEVLAGTEGKIEESKIVESRPGEDVALTIDPNIQAEAEKVLAHLVESFGASGGTVIVEEPKTGKILAMGSVPNFDPNVYSSSSLSSFLNPATQQVYEPGSVFKVLTMSAGIDAGKITPDTTYYDAGSLTLNGRTIQNYDLKTHGAYGRATMTNVIEHSINTGAVFAERATGREIFAKYITQFGFSEKTGVDLPNEVAGNLTRLNPKERDIAFATASYGQGVATTPLELIDAIAAIANGGTLMRPYVNAGLSPEAIRRVVSEDTAQKVTGMMISAVDKADVATISGYSLAGKTGTAFMPDFKNGGYTDRVIDSYVGFGPTSDPKFIVLIKIDNLDSSQLAALSVVPAFRDLAQYILNYYNIQPDRITSNP
jgi:cell division protein FtsI/penicillin-binding protein 2